MVIYISLLNIITLNQKKKKHYCTRKARVMSLVLYTHFSKYLTSDYLFYTTFYHNTISISICYYYLKSSLSSTTKNHGPQSN